MVNAVLDPHALLLMVSHKYKDLLNALPMFLQGSCSSPA